jgi:hypothetical protein
MWNIDGVMIRVIQSVLAWARGTADAVRLDYY